jgi:uncharacterized protein YprB with RNaseH-like and TPR domain
MLRCTFQLGTGIGVRRERQLWMARITDWSHLPRAPPEVLPVRLREPLLAAAAALEEALGEDPAGARALLAAAAAIPAGEHWRLAERFAERAVYLDIETNFDEGITAIGILDGAGPRILLPGRGLDSFPEQVGAAAVLVTFNGGAYDLPILRRSFPDWRPPVAHIDLKPVLARLGERGGLKAIEERLGLGRPDHLRGLSGFGAANLYRHGVRGNRAALRLFAEYNLYDAVNLRTLLGLAYNRTVDALGLPATRVSVSWRGDVLYDVSKTLLAL